MRYANKNLSFSFSNETRLSTSKTRGAEGKEHTPGHFQFNSNLSKSGTKIYLQNMTCVKGQQTKDDFNLSLNEPFA